jgi:hypothetical protein
MNFSFPTPHIHKFCEFNFHILTDICSWFDLRISYQTKCDHAGLYFRFSLFKLFFLSFNIYDNRHWNFEKNRWYDHSEEWDLHCYSQKECNIKRLTSKFTRDDADKLLSDITRLQPMIHSVFMKADHKFVKEFYQEISISIKDLEDWLRKVVYGKDKI